MLTPLHQKIVILLKNMQANVFLNFVGIFRINKNFEIIKKAFIESTIKRFFIETNIYLMAK